MPLTVCRCCGGRMEPEQARLNPNICASCERLLEDESPIFMADMAQFTSARNGADELLDEPENFPQADLKPDTIPSDHTKTSSG